MLYFIFVIKFDNENRNKIIFSVSLDKLVSMF
jgi:hypothetical protein